MNVLILASTSAVRARLLRDASVAGRGDDPGPRGRCEAGLDERVLASAGTDDKYVGREWHG